MTYEFCGDTVQSIAVALFCIFRNLLKSSLIKESCILIPNSAYSHCAVVLVEVNEENPTPNSYVDGKGSILIALSGTSG